jgi:hypothetical protein
MAQLQSPKVMLGVLKGFAMEVNTSGIKYNSPGIE